MGSNLTNGAPTVAGKCTVRYDNLGYIFGTSSDVFFAACSVIPPANSTSNAQVFEGLVAKAHEPAFFDLFGVYPNPFYKYQRSSQVQAEPVLTMVDGGATLQSMYIHLLVPGAMQCVHILTNCCRQPNLAVHPAFPQRRRTDRE